MLTATGTRDMEQLGGLIHRMKLTSFAFLVGCAAISALPPLNGFASEWLTFQAILISPALPQWALKFAIPAVGALLALSAALAAACFVKAFGVTFLGRPRSKAAERAKEVDRFSLAAMFAFAGLCVLAGVLPGLVDRRARADGQQASSARRCRASRRSPWLSIVPIAESRSSYNGLLLFVFIAASATIAAFAIHRFASRACRRSDPWDCGFPDREPGDAIFRRQLRAADPPRLRHAGLRRARACRHAAARLDASGALRGDAARPRSGTGSTRRSPSASASPPTGLNALQFLSIRRYLTLVFTTLVVLLLVLALWP